MIHPDIVERIKASVNCSDLLEPSKNRMFCCPKCGSGHGIHGTGAVKYYSDSKEWHCHKCGAHGDVIDLYQHQTGAGFKEAINALAARAGISIDASKAKKPLLTGDQHGNRATLQHRVRPSGGPGILTRRADRCGQAARGTPNYYPVYT